MTRIMESRLRQRRQTQKKSLSKNFNHLKLKPQKK